MQMLAAFVGGLTVQVGWLGLRVGGHPAVILRLLNEPDELLQWLCHDDSTINIIMVLLFTCYFHRNTVRFLSVANNLYIPETDFRQMACKLQEVTFSWFAKVFEP